jgi:hypothetical protein
MSIQQHILLRYRGGGHVRFEIPPPLCRDDSAERLCKELARVPGVYRVDVYRRQGKLSVRYDQAACVFRELLAALHALAGSLGEEGTGEPGALRAPEADGFGRWMRGKLQEARETFDALGIVARRLSKRGGSLTGNGEKLALEFFTDALVLYLIKVHWHLITQHWLKRPWQYRYEWLAAWYLIYLLVRSKRPKP